MNEKFFIEGRSYRRIQVGATVIEEKVDPVFRVTVPPLTLGAPATIDFALFDFDGELRPAAADVVVLVDGTRVSCSMSGGTFSLEVTLFDPGRVVLALEPAEDLYMEPVVLEAR